MCENRPDAENRTPFFSAPKNTPDTSAAPARTPLAPPLGELSAQPTERAFSSASADSSRAPLAPPLGELSAQPTERAFSSVSANPSADTPNTGDISAPVQPRSFFCHPADKWALPAALWLGYLYCRMIFSDNDYRWPFHIRLGADGPWFYILPLLLCAAFAAAVTLWCRLRQVKGSAESPLWLGCLVLTAFGFGFDRLNAFGWGLGWLAFHGFALVWALARTGQLTENRTGPAFVPDVLRGVGRGFAGLAVWPCGAWALWTERPRRQKAKKGDPVPAVLCVLGALVLLLLAAKELAGADDGFADLLQGAVDALVFWKGFSPDWSVIVSLFFMFPVGAFFYGFTAAGHAALEKTPRPALQRYADGLAPLRRVSARLLCGVLAAFAVLYLAFFGVQSGYLFGAFTGRLPQGFTVANYARQGFFELCRVMLLNFVLLAGVDAVCRTPLRRHTGLRTGGAVLLVQSLLLWSTAASKLGLYIGTFGFTAKRLQAAWALLVLAVAGVRYLASLWKPCSILRPTVLVGAVSFALLCLY